MNNARAYGLRAARLLLFDKQVNREAAERYDTLYCDHETLSRALASQ